MEYSFACVAGTFDGIHYGHEALLRRAFEVGDQVLIGITSDEYILRFKSPRLPKSPRSLSERKQDLIGWLVAHGYVSDRYEIVPIDDPFEPAASDPRLDALVVSEETQDRGEELNQKREERGLPPLHLVVIPMVPANGKLVMPDSLRPELVKPLGPVRTSLARSHLARLIITVGDVTTKTFLDAGIVPSLMVIDHKVNRKPYTEFDLSSFSTMTLVSGPGYIARRAGRIIRKALSNKEPQVLDVIGEEDLLVLPAIIAAPIGARVYYGQPNKGMVEVIVTKQIKKKVFELLRQFV